MANTLLVTYPAGVMRPFFVDQDSSDLYVACDYWYPNNSYSGPSNCPVNLLDDNLDLIANLDPLPNQTPGPQRVDYHFSGLSLVEDQVIYVQFVAVGPASQYWMGVINPRVSTEPIA